VNDLCKLFYHILPSTSSCPLSFKVAKRIINNATAKELGDFCSIIHKVCGFCASGLINERCEKCQNGVGRSPKPGYYFTCSIKKQLQIIMKNYGAVIIKFLEDANKIRETPDCVTDIVTGQLYKDRCLPNPNKNELFLHLLLNADGAKFTKSKFGSFWPIDAEVVELPKKIRSKFENIVLLLLWQGEKKPPWGQVLETAKNELFVLSTLGFETNIDGQNYTVYVRIIATVFDLPAKASIWNTVQWNGKLF
jgi:hypothetical protein